MPSDGVIRGLDGVREALERKGFEGLFVAHYDNTPADHLVLHDDLGGLARGQGDRIQRIIEQARDIDDLVRPGPLRHDREVAGPPILIHRPTEAWAPSRSHGLPEARVFIPASRSTWSARTGTW